MTTEEFADARLAAFGRGDVNAIVAQYADDAIVITPQGTLRGQAQIRGMIEGIIAEFAQPGVKFDLISRAAEGPVANFTWSAETNANVWDLGAETYVLANGRIAFQTFAGKMRPKA
jgi:ketosteroid isomerase-like protein